MNQSATEKIRLGIFVVLGTALLLTGAYLIGNRQNMFAKTFTINVVFKNVNGLQKGNNVRYAGINIGTVSGITMKNDTVINVRMVIEDAMLKHIKKDAVATIGSDGLVGSMIVNIVPGPGDTVLVQPGDTIISYSRIGAEDMLSTLNVTGENAALLTADLLEVTQVIKAGKGTIGRLIRDTTMASDMKQTFANLRRTSEETNKSIKKINDLISQIDLENSLAGFLVNDSTAATRMRNAVKDIEQSGKKMSSILENLDSVITEVKDSEGGFHYLVGDSSFVKSLEQTMKNIESGTKKFDENMEALQHNFLTRRYFKKLEKEQERQQE